MTYVLYASTAICRIQEEICISCKCEHKRGRAFQLRFVVLILNKVYILLDTLFLATSSVQQSQFEACQTGNYLCYVKLLNTVPAPT